MSAFPCAISYIICLIALTQGITVQIPGITIAIPLSRLIDSYHKRGIIFVPKIGTGRPSAQVSFHVWRVFLCAEFTHSRGFTHSLTPLRQAGQVRQYNLSSSFYPKRATIAITPSRIIPRRGFAVRNQLSSVSFTKLQTNRAVNITTKSVYSTSTQDTSAKKTIENPPLSLSG